MSEPLPGWRLWPTSQCLTPVPTYWRQHCICSALSIPGLAGFDAWRSVVITFKVSHIQQYERPYQHCLQHLQWTITYLLQYQHHNNWFTDQSVSYSVSRAFHLIFHIQSLIYLLFIVVIWNPRFLVSYSMNNFYRARIMIKHCALFAFEHHYC